MKILVVTPSLGPLYGGPTKAVLELTQALSKLGALVDIVTTNMNRLNNLNVPLRKWINYKTYRVQYFPRWQVKDYTLSLSLTHWLLSHVGDYDLVHIHTVFAYPVLPAYWACRLHQVPYIRTPHGMLEPWALSYKAWKKKLYYTLLEKPALQKASFLHALATCEANHLQALALKPPTAVIANGIHRDEFESLPDPEIFYQKFPATRNKVLVLFLGRVDPKKGLDLLASAFSNLQQQFPQTHLVVAGPDDVGFQQTAQTYFDQAGCAEAVTFTGMVTGSVKGALLAAANVYVAPSYSEGFSMSVLEGMASGLACVITTGCNFPEASAAQAAFVVEPEANAIADALVQCLSRPEEAKEMGGRARQFIFEHYTWERIARQMLKTYTAAVDQDLTTSKQSANLSSALWPRQSPKL